MVLKWIIIHGDSLYTYKLLINTSKKTHISDILIVIKTHSDCLNVGERYQGITPIAHYPSG